MKKIFAILMIAVMLLGALPAGILAAYAAEPISLDGSSISGSVHPEAEHEPRPGTPEAVNAAKNALDEALEKEARGFYGFVEWMLENPALSEKERADLNAAKRILNDAVQEDFSKWYGGDNTGLPATRNNKVVVLNDEKDANAFDNIQPAIEVMKTINQLRAGDDNYVGTMQRNPGKTNFYVMAIAISGADRGAGLVRHSLLQISCENLAFGYAVPTDGWYTLEKADFDRIRQQLGITALTEDTLKKIEEAASAQNTTIGHYTNLMWSADQVMGIGRTQYRTTSCYNATKTSNLEDKYRVYTIEEFENLFAAYTAALNLDALQAAYDAALTAYEQQPEHEPEPDPEPDPTVFFADVAPGAWYYEAVSWAVENGVTSGVTESAFCPDDSCTRAQIVTFLWRVCGSPAPKDTTLSFTDVKPDSYYADAVRWAVEQGITTGTKPGLFSPNAACTRAQAVTFLCRAAGKPGPNSANPFVDVQPEDFCFDAIRWAVETGIAKGMSETAFGPDRSCTRAQIVTFLYRMYAG